MTERNVGTFSTQRRREERLRWWLRRWGVSLTSSQFQSLEASRYVGKLEKRRTPSRQRFRVEQVGALCQSCETAFED